LGHAGRITLVAGEPVLPYDRTALSKSMLTSQQLEPRLLSYRDAYRTADIDVRLGSRASALDVAGHVVRCDDGTEVSYDRVVVATGALAVLPTGLNAPGVRTVRDLQDLEALREQLVVSESVLIVGGGLIGCELACALRNRIESVTVIEQSTGPLAEFLGSRAASRLAEFQRGNGVRYLSSTGVQSIVRATDGAYTVITNGGASLAADCIVVAVGAIPCTDWLAGSGVQIHGGLVTDAYCATSAPDVFAAGDCARFASLRTGLNVRLEHWDSAARHGVAAAENVMGEKSVFDPVPFFWSDQFGAKLSMAGLPAPRDHISIVDVDDGFVATYRGQLGVNAVFGLNSTRAVVSFRRELEGAVNAGSHN
jgi:NADPH-dependent 2,4-dienoyl-CoA reductase/sulfur reductase-like enzyme